MSPWAEENDTDRDSLPELQSVTESEPDMTQVSTSMELLEDLLAEEEAELSFHKEILLAPPMQFRHCYQMLVDNSEEKLALLNIDSKCTCLGNAAYHKLEEMLEHMQPYL
ncbi:hypothetical protein C0995_005790, partial [Termitomyces sp. Mi166